MADDFSSADGDVLRILIYGINYSPELTGIGKYTGEMAEFLARHGHDVRVVTAPPYYPEWRIPEGYSSNRYVREDLNGVQVVRSPLWVPSRPSGLARLAHLLSFALASAPALWLQCRWKPDVVWVATPTLFCAPSVLALARVSGARSWLHVQDFELDAAFEMELLKGKKLRKWLTELERRLLHRFDRVSTISGRMLALARSKGIDAERLVLFPNWVDTCAIRPLSAPSPYRQELGIALGTTVVLYSGNMGRKQGLEILASVARLLSEEENLAFVFCGDGAGKAELVEACRDLENVHFLALQPAQRLGHLLGLADIHLLPQRADAADLVMPSKLTGMLASGRAVIATAAAGTELASVVQDRAKCGLVVPPENVTALADAVRSLAADQERRKAMGENGRRYAEAELGRKQVLLNFECELRSCASS